MVSGQNVWIENKALVPRSGLTQIGDNSAVSDTAGKDATAHVNAVFTVFKGHDTGAVESLLAVASVSTVGTGSNVFSYFSSTDTTTPFIGSWSTLSQTLANGLDTAPDANNDYTWFGSNVSLARTGATVFVTVNPGNTATQYPYVWQPGQGVFSILTESPLGAIDVCRFDNSPILWLTDGKVQWPTGADMEDWTSVGAGNESLVDMQGEPTRIFGEEDQMVIASTKEIWRGRKIGGAFRFAFNPIARELGMPFPAAAVQTPFGIYWLNDDYMVYHLSGNAINPVGQSILQTLRNEIRGNPEQTTLFMTYDPNKMTVTLHYTTDVTTSGADRDFAPGADRAFTAHILEKGVWTPQRFGHKLTCGAVSNWKRLKTTDAVTPYLMTNEPGVFFGSASTAFVLAYSGTTTLDLDTAKEAQWQSGGLFTGDPIHMKWSDKVRLDARADSTSNISVAVSGNLGTSQAVVPTGVSGQYHSLRLRSEDTGWRVSRCMVRARVQGEFNG
jgi:hypothetical protein